MNFNEWYESETKRHGYCHEEHDCRLAWSACRNQILGILRKKLQYYEGSRLNSFHYIDESAIEEIKNL